MLILGGRAILIRNGVYWVDYDAIGIQLEAT